MNKNSPTSLIVILLTFAAAIYFIFPSVLFYSKTPAQQLVEREKNPAVLKKIFNLGLDLQGGMRLVLEVDRSKLDEKQSHDVLDRAFAVIENRINALGVAEPSIQKQGKDRLIIELPGLSNEGAAKGVIGRTAQLEFQLLREPAQLERAVKVIDDVLKGNAGADSTVTDSAATGEEDAQNLAERLFAGTDAEGSKEKAVVPAAEQEAGTGAAGDVLLAGVTSFKGLLARVGGSMIGASPKNRAKIDHVLLLPEVRRALDRAGLGGNQFLWGHDTTMVSGKPFRMLYYVKGHPEMRGDVIKDARQELDRKSLGGGYSVDLEMNARGARLFSRVTGRNVGKYLAIVLDSTVYSAPVIRQKIPLGRAQISGSFSLDEARNLAIVLRAGALPAPVRVIEERTVGPSLGQDSILKGLYACLAGFIIVVIFMTIYYKVSGLIANFALLLNLLFVLAIMAGIHATLTLPGIAGLILIVGMAVDANVIVFERIREELRLGKTVRSAISAGYSRAFLTIFDANLTTLITAAILLWIGTGPIKGFAITLIIGIIVSLFTALFVTKAIFNIMTLGNKDNKLSI